MNTVCSSREHIVSIELLVKMGEENVQLSFSDRIPLPVSSPEFVADPLSLRDSPFPGHEGDSPPARL